MLRNLRTVYKQGGARRVADGREWYNGVMWAHRVHLGASAIESTRRVMMTGLPCSRSRLLEPQ